MFGVFEHRTLSSTESLLRGFDDIFFAPHSRHTEIRRADLEKVSDIQILAESDQAGIYIVATKDGRHIFVTGHSEYDPLTLKSEYDRDIKKGLPIHVPANYYPTTTRHGAASPLARTLQSIVRKLAELLRLSSHAL